MARGRGWIGGRQMRNSRSDYIAAVALHKFFMKLLLRPYADLGGQEQGARLQEQLPDKATQREASCAMPERGAAAAESCAPQSFILEEHDCMRAEGQSACATKRGVCVVCLEREATLLGRACGHMAWCRTCRRTAVHAALGKYGSKRNLSAKELDRTRLSCPICRVETCIVRRNGLGISGATIFVPLEE